MIELPASSLSLLDATGRSFGRLRVVPHEHKPYAECIFDVAPVDEAQAARPEVRWGCKRHYRRYSEHQLRIAADGTLTISKADFRWVLEPDEGGGYTSRFPAPKVRAVWSDEA